MQALFICFPSVNLKLQMRLINSQHTDKQTGRLTNRQADWQTDRQTAGRQTDRQTGRLQAGRLTDRQADCRQADWQTGEAGISWACPVCGECFCNNMVHHSVYTMWLTDKLHHKPRWRQHYNAHRPFNRHCVAVLRLCYIVTFPIHHVVTVITVNTHRAGIVGRCDFGQHVSFFFRETRFIDFSSMIDRKICSLQIILCSMLYSTT